MITQNGVVNLRRPSHFRSTSSGLRIGLVLVGALLVLLAHMSQARLPGLRVLEATARDGLMRAMAHEVEDPRLAIVDIDEESLRRLGAWPWPRERLAELAEQILSEAGAARVVFDLVLPAEADGADGGNRGGGADRPEAAERGLMALDAGDARLVALAKAGALVLGQALDYEQREAPVASGALGGGLGGTAGVTSGLPHAGPAAIASGYVGNFPALAAGRCVGNIGVVPDFDGQTRRLAPLTTLDGRLYPTLALATMACTTRQVDMPALAAQLPVNDQGLWRVPFRHRPAAHVAVPAHEVLAGTVDQTGRAPLLAGRVVLVGSSALGLADRVATPTSPNVSGVTVHVEALSWLMDLHEGRTPSPLPPGVMLAWALASGLGLAWAVSGARAGWRRALGALAVVGSGWLGLAAWATATGSTQPVSTPLLAYALVMLVQLPLEWARAQGRIRRQARLLGRYVAPSVLEQLQRSGGGDVLTPRRAQITVLIADMQDYTRNTADAGLVEAARLTKGFLQSLTEPVLQARGTLDRYTGDGLVAFWGAPIAETEHADLAVDAALAIVQRVREFNEERRSQGLVEVRVRMGLASGEALVGDLGTRFRIAYTAVGDCINLASRLQQASREVDVSILASESVERACRRHSFNSLGRLAIRGLPDQAVSTPREGRAIRSDSEGGLGGG
jgi:adenylate cyclase